MKKIKTNVMRSLEKENIAYEFYQYKIRPQITLEQLSSDIGQDPHLIFKTLVTVSEEQNYYVFCLPLEEELDLKKAARAAQVKNLHMIDQKDLFYITGYERGGVSPLSMKKNLPTFIDDKARLLEKMIISAGKKGYQIGVHPEDLLKITQGTFTNLLKETKSIF